MRLLFNLAILTTLVSSGCYFGFKGISIQPDVKSYYVHDFINKHPDNAQNIDQLFAEALRMKVRDESRLTNDEVEPDVEFMGSVDETRITPVAAQEGNTTSLNRMEIFVEIEYLNNKHEKDSWKKKYSAYRDFDRNQDFNSVRDGLTDEIIENIMERVFNDAFTNW